MTRRLRWHRLEAGRIRAGDVVAALGIDPSLGRPLTLDDLAHPYATPGLAAIVDRLVDVPAFRVEVVSDELACHAAATILRAYLPLDRRGLLIEVGDDELRFAFGGGETGLMRGEDRPLRDDAASGIPLSAATLAFKLVQGLVFGRLPELRGDVVVFDFETTGLDEMVDEVVEIGAVKLRHGFPLATFDRLVRPTLRIPEAVSRVHGITNDMVAEADRAEVVFADFLAFIEGARLVAHNARFDAGFLRRFGRELFGRSVDNPLSDTLEMSRRLLPLRRFSLDLVAGHLGVSLAPAEAHRAFPDARATASVYVRLAALAHRERFADLDLAAALAALGQLDPEVVLGVENHRLGAVGLQALAQCHRWTARLGARLRRLVGVERGRLARRAPVPAAHQGIGKVFAALEAAYGGGQGPSTSSLLAKIIRPPAECAPVGFYVEAGGAELLLPLLQLLAPFGPGNPPPLVQDRARRGVDLVPNRLATALVEIPA